MVLIIFGELTTQTQLVPGDLFVYSYCEGWGWAAAGWRVPGAAGLQNLFIFTIQDIGFGIKPNKPQRDKKTVLCGMGSNLLNKMSPNCQ